MSLTDAATAHEIARATFSEAMQAWFTGAFERCLLICDELRARDPEDDVRITLLRARAMLRLGRSADALAVLTGAQYGNISGDSSATAMMLTAAAHIRLGDYDSGLTLLHEAREAFPLAHASIQSEISLTESLAFYRTGAFDAADAALSAVDKNSDIIYARSLEYRGWIETARGRYTSASAFFSTALMHLDQCQHYDRFLEANVLMALAILAAECFDLEGSRIVEQRATNLDWSADGLTLPRFCVNVAASMQLETIGDRKAAMRLAGAAAHAAPSDALRASALCRIGNILHGAGERLSHADYCDRARTEFERCDQSRLSGDEVYVPLSLAEESACAGDLDIAKHYLAVYRGLAKSLPVVPNLGDSRREAFEQIIEAQVLDASGNEAAAQHSYIAAMDQFDRLGYKRRATMAALRLGELTKRDAYFDYARQATMNLSPGFWMRARVHHRAALYENRVLSALTPMQRELLLLVCDGITTEQIAKLRMRSKYTIRNAISDLLEMFQVADRKQLIAECARRGLINGPARSTRIDM